MTVTAKETKTQTTPAKKKSGKSQEPSMKESLTEYFKGVKSEWRKITWPDRQQLLQETLVVLGVTAFTTILIYLIDVILRYLVGLVQ